MHPNKKILTIPFIITLILLFSFNANADVKKAVTMKPLTVAPKTPLSLGARSDIKANITQPSSGGTIWLDKVIDIRWSTEGSLDKKARLDILLFNGKTLVDTIAKGIIAKEQKFSWFVNTGLTTQKSSSGNQYRIQLVNSETSKVIDTSGYFSIEKITESIFKVNSPRAGSTTYWCKGNSYPVRWETINPRVESYNIDLIQERTGQVVIPIAQDVPTTGSINFDPSVTSGSTSLLKLRFKNGAFEWKNAFVSVLDAPFNIQKLYGVRIGSSLELELQQFCPVSSNISFELLDQNHQTVAILFNEIPSANGHTTRKFECVIPSVPAGDYFIRVTDGTTHYDEDLEIY